MAEPSRRWSVGVQWVRTASSTPFSLEEAARRIGHYAWIEMKLFEVLGGWVVAVPEAEVKLCLATQAPHHAWHAELWVARLPVLRELDRDRLVRPPNAELEALIGLLAAPDEPDRTIEKLVGVYRVLVPRLVSAYSQHLEVASAVADAPTIRTLRLALQDELEDWREGERLLQGLLVGATEVARAAAHQARVETALVAAGGITGDAGQPLGT